MGVGEDGTPVAPDVVGLELLLSQWRTEQAAGGTQSARPVRFVIERETPEDDAAVADRVGRALQVRVTVEPLFPGDADLERFRLLTVPGVERPDRADLFELANAIRRLLDARTVEPDVGTDYFECERPPPLTGTPEGADWTFWCWAPDSDKPADVNWALTMSNVQAAWVHAAEQGKAGMGKGISVFQPDTGVVPRHAEMPAGVEQDPRSANLVENGGPPVDPMTGGMNPGHGTGTGSVAASPEAGGMAGAAPLATLIPIRCIESVAVIDQSPVARAIAHAASKGAHVVTMSLGGVPSSALHAAVRKAVEGNAIVVAAAGNCVREVVWPARYEEAIAVGGVNHKSRPWRGSCLGPAIDVSAPAEFVLRADAQHLSGAQSVGGGQGTSFATALTAGVAALWLAHHGRDRLIGLLPPGRTLQWLFRAMVMATARRPDGFDHGNYGAGIVDALALLKRDPAAFVAAAGAQAGAPRAGDLVSLIRQAFGAGGAEAAGAALDDPQHAPELACAAFDRLRAMQTLRGHVESLPPPMLSPSLRAKLAARAGEFR